MVQPETPWVLMSCVHMSSSEALQILSDTIRELLHVFALVVLCLIVGIFFSSARGFIGNTSGSCRGTKYYRKHFGCFCCVCDVLSKILFCYFSCPNPSK